MTQPTILERQLEASVTEVQQKKGLVKVEPTALARPEPTWAMMREQANELVKSGFLPKAVNTPEKAMAIIQTGKELGLGPMQSLRSIHIIEGKPTMSADLIAGLALQRVPGSVLRVIESTDQRCVVEANRPGHEPTKFTWTMSDAQKAGLTNKDNWRKYPRAMLRARVITEAARAMMPDAVVGLYDPDELGAVTSPTGEVVELPRVQDAYRDKERTAGYQSPDDKPAHVDPGDYARAMENLRDCDSAVFDPGCTWETMTKWRSRLGRKGEPTPFSLQLSDMYRGDISPTERKELSALWNRVDRKLTQLEGKLKAPAVEASFTDEPDGTEVLGAREPGEDEDEI